MKLNSTKMWLFLACFCLLICTSCNIKKPLRDVLTEANLQPAPFLQVDSKVDTLFLDRFFPNLTAVDSLSNKGLRLLPIDNDRNAFLVEIHDTTRIFHPISIFKGGKWVSVMAFYNDTTRRRIEDSTFVMFKGMLNKRLMFECQTRPSEFYVLWQNVILPSSFITFGKNSISIQLPKETRQIKESYLRIFAAEGTKIVLDRRYSLIYGTL